MLPSELYLLQHVGESLWLQVYDKCFLLPTVQVLQELPVVGVVEVLHADCTDLPAILTCFLHDGLQDGVSCKREEKKVFINQSEGCELTVCCAERLNRHSIPDKMNVRQNLRQISIKSLSESMCRWNASHAA